MDDKPKPQPIPEVRVGDENVPTFYANHMNVIVTPWDMRIRFSQIESASKDGLMLRDVASVFLSPGQAQSLRKLLNENAASHDALWKQTDMIVARLGKEEE